MTYFECYADESFLRFLGLNRKELSGGHSNGRSNVSRKLRKAEGVGVTGFIDEDPGAPKESYLSYLFSLAPNYSDSHIIHILDVNTKNELIVIRPDLEGLAISIAKDRKIDLSREYGLSMNRGDLHDMLRIERNISKRKKLIDFFSEVSTHSTIIKLKELINS